ncbi:MAG TPA: roadblock/LC7 domain-containing protein [Deltaproteobacteria bacterium]|nr:roadblock/LC7 domain-containing protein [Deltaproteobacteria bacterium]HXK47825.1 roadblock/LC7 domain-containing protein [Deltaproteobacteria bacterium]
MAKVEELVNGIQKIQGLEGYILVKQDGQVVSHNVSNVERLSAMIAVSGSMGNTVKTELGASHFRYLMLARKTNEKLLVIPIESFILGVLQDPDAYTPDIVSKIQSVINGLRAR